MVYLTTWVTPVSGSISTSQMWQPFGKFEGAVSCTSLTSSVCGTPEGSLILPVRSRSASSIRPIERSVPAMTKRPRANSMSATAASSACAAICLPLSMTLLPASMMAPPPE